MSEPPQAYTEKRADQKALPRRQVLELAAASFLLLGIGCFALVWPRQPYLFGLIGNDGTHLEEEREAGIGAKLFSLSWRAFYPEEGRRDAGYVSSKEAELQSLKDAGFEVILSLGFHDTPTWLHANYPNSYYVNQFAERYTAGGLRDMGDANLVFNPQLRALVSSYMEEVFSDFGTGFYAVRLGGGHYGELTYPSAQASPSGKTNFYWAYDSNAARQNPVPGWKPGEPSPHREAARFAGWYLNALVEYQNWQVETVRKAGYPARIMMLYPSWGLRPGQVTGAGEGNLSGDTSAEINGEVQRGYAFARQVRAISDPRVMVTTTWLDAPLKWSSPTNPTPVEYLSYLAQSHEPALELYGENTGAGSRTEMEFSISQMRRYGLSGMAWFREEEMFSGRYASLGDYRNLIAAAGEQTN